MGGAWPWITSVFEKAQNQSPHTERGASNPVQNGSKRNDKVKDTLLEIPQDPGFIKLQENSISYLMMYTKNEL